MKKIHLSSAVISMSTVILITGCVNPILSSSSISSSISSQISSPSISISSSVSSSSSESSTSASSSTSVVTSSSLKIISINDFHGAIEPGTYNQGIARIGEFMLNEKAKTTQDTIIIANGDIFQGTALSYQSRGGLIVDVFNHIDIDAMTIGNHEFDWGVDDIQAYHDGNLENGEADFPFLGANIYDKETNTKVDWLDAYQIVDFGEYQAGIIGLMGYGLENSISTSIIAPYEFVSPTTIAYDIATDLRANHGVDFIVAAVHDRDDYTNSQLAQFGESARIDAILNGHTHQEYTQNINGSDGRVVPVIQSGSSGSHIGELIFDVTTNQLPYYTSKRNVYVSSSLAENATIVAMRDEAALNAAPIIYEVLGEAGESVDRYDAGNWAADVIKHAFADVDVAAVNMGGIRSAGFPIVDGQDVTYANIFAIMPFDNYVKAVTLTGSQLVDVISNNTDGLVFDYDLDTSALTINGEPIVSTNYYRFATVDYIFDKTKYAFTTRIDPEFTGILLRELLVQDVRLTGANGWYPSQGAVITPLPQ